MKKNTKKWVLGIMAVCIIGAMIYWGYSAMQAQDNPYDVTGTGTTATDWTLNIKNQTGYALSDGEAYGNVFGYDASDIEGFDQTDLDALGYADLTLVDTLSDGESFTPKAKNYYWLLVNGSLYTDDWTYLSSEPLGDVNVTLLATPTAAYIAGQSTKGSVAINETNDVHWYFTVMMVDANYEVTSDYGYSTTLDYSLVSDMDNTAAARTYNVIEFDCNDTDALVDDDITIKNHPEFTSKISGDKYQFYTTGTFVGSVTYEFEFSSNMGTTFEINAVAYKHGVLSSLTSIDSF
jgi:hypothetical protein